MNTCIRNGLRSIIIFSILTGCRSGNDGNIDFNQRLSFDPTHKLGFRPNIVWLVTEDLKPILPAFGDSTVNTPNLDRLAREGVRYTRVFSPSGVCAPSRCAITTGMYPSSIGGHNMRVQYNREILEKIGLQLYEIVPPPEVKMMSQILRENGYYCTNNNKTDYQFAHPLTAWDESSLTAHWRKRPKGKPFYSVFNFEVTHEGEIANPFREQLLRYDDPDFPFTHPENIPYNQRLSPEVWTLHIPEDLEVPVPPYLPSTEAAKNEIRRVYSNMVDMDRQVGVLLRQLEADGLLDSTIVVWFADNGGPLPRQKRLLYDDGIHVPMIIRFPGKKGAGMYDDQLVSFIDLAPAFFSILGIKPPDHLQGQAFLGQFKADHPRKYIHAAADRLDSEYDMIRAVRDNRFKYLRNHFPDRPYYLPITYREQLVTMQELLRLRDEGGLNEYQAQWFRTTKPEEELFDTWKDPFELNNLAHDPDYAEKLKELRAECDNWMNSIGDMGHTPEDKILEMFWPGRKQPETVKPEYQLMESKIQLSCSTPGAHIGYQLFDIESAPGITWQVYKEPFLITPNSVLLVMAHRIGYSPSDTLRVEFR